MNFQIYSTFSGKYALTFLCLSGTLDFLRSFNETNKIFSTQKVEYWDAGSSDERDKDIQVFIERRNMFW